MTTNLTLIDVIELSYNAFHSIDYDKFLEITKFSDDYYGQYNWSKFSGHYFVAVLSYDAKIRKHFDDFLSDYIEERL